METVIQRAERLFAPYAYGRLQKFRTSFDAIEDTLGIHVECTASAITIFDRRPAQAAPQPTCYAGNSAGGQ